MKAEIYLQLPSKFGLEFIENISIPPFTDFFKIKQVHCKEKNNSIILSLKFTICLKSSIGEILLYFLIKDAHDNSVRSHNSCIKTSNVP